MYNLQNEKCQQVFKEHTNNTHMAKIFESSDELNKLTKKFLNYLDGAIKKCFKKHRTTTKRKNMLENLYKKRRQIKNKDDPRKDILIKDIEKEIAHEACKQIDDSIKGLNSEKGGFNPGHMWRLKSKIVPKPVQVPTAMNDPKSGKQVTLDSYLKKHTVSYYENVLRNREINEDLKDHKKEREELCQMRLEETKQKKTKDWTEEDLLKALKDLKMKKSRYPNMYANEICQPKIAGKDLVKAILSLMNRIKNDSLYPSSLTLCNITSIYKHKGSPNSYSSYCGIFRVQALRNILKRLIYNDEYSNIDTNLTDANVGARKKRNIRDNIYVLNAVMNETTQGSK